MRLRLLLLAGVIAATAFLIVGVALGEADWQACLERSLSRAFPNSQSSSAQPTAAWTVALRALTSPSGDALLIVATVLPTLVAVVLARRPSQQAIALVPMARPVGRALLAWGDMHDL